MSEQNAELLKQGKLEPVPEVCERRTGNRPAPATIHRWGRKGVKGGVKLQMAYICGSWCTTDAAFDQFIADQTAERTGGDTGDDDQAERDPATERRLQNAGLL